MRVHGFSRPARGYNELKREALAIFDSHDWLRPPDWALLARFWPPRSAYSYLKRLWFWRLLERRRDARGLLVYRLSDRGRDRLRWLRRNSR